MTEELRLFASLYTDEDITGRLAVALRQRNFEAIAAHEAGLVSEPDEKHLAYATEHKMALLTCNRDDFIRLAHEWAAIERQHYGIIISPQFSNQQFGELLGLTLNLLNRITADELENVVFYLTSFR